MTPEDLRRIEDALAIRLPASYRSRMVHFPLPAAVGNTDLGIWDNAERLIEYNLELRRGAPGGVKPWPARFFAIGHEGDGCPRALDLDAGDAVWWVDRCHLDNPSSQKEADSFSAWADDYFATLREEMAGELVDPDGSPAERAAVEAKGVRGQALSCLLLAAIVGAVIMALRWWVKG